MTQQLTLALEQANNIIATQLNLEQCPTEGLPNLQREMCLQCDQIGPCIWRHVSSNSPVTQSSSVLRKDLAFAHKLINQAVTNLTLSPSYHKQALTWLRNTASFIPSSKKT